MTPWNSFADPLIQYMDIFDGWIKNQPRTPNPKVKIVHKNSIEESSEDEWLRQLHDGWAGTSKTS